MFVYCPIQGVEDPWFSSPTLNSTELPMRFRELIFPFNLTQSVDTSQSVDT